MLSSVPTADSAAAAAAISPAMADAARSPTHLPSAAGEAVGGELRKRRRDWGSAAEEDGFSAGFDDGEASKRRGKPQDVVFRVVVPSRQIGRVIGKEGSQIRSIREDTRATIKIADAVSVSGQVPEVLLALEKIGSKLRENPPTKVISIRPSHNTGSRRSNGSLPSGRIHDSMQLDELVSMDLMISEAHVGGLIGKQGSNISKIRNESGATIKVSGARGEAYHRMVHFSGTSEQVAVAKSLVERYIYSQSVPQSISMGNVG